MRRVELWRLGVANVFSTPLRSLLTVLGMAVGIGAVLTVLTLSEAGRTQVQSEMMRLGIDKVWVTSERDARLRHGDGAWLSQALGTDVMELAYCPALLRVGEKQAEGVVVGCSDAYLALMETRTLYGRALWPLEWRAGSRTVLVGERLARSLSLTDAFALEDERLSLGGVPLRVAGVVAQENGLAQIQADNAVFVPIDVYCELIGEDIYELMVHVPQRFEPRELALRASAALAQRRSLSVNAVTMQLQLDAANEVMTIFINVLTWVAGVCILVGGIGVMNLLLVSVRARRREIGVMRSLGASSGQICGVFLFEALLYALIGGALGLMVGLGMTAAAARVIGLSPATAVEDAALVEAVALLIGLVFGVAPARLAAALTPVEALRD